MKPLKTGCPILTSMRRRLPNKDHDDYLNLVEFLVGDRVTVSGDTPLKELYGEDEEKHPMFGKVSGRPAIIKRLSKDGKSLEAEEQANAADLCFEAGSLNAIPTERLDPINDANAFGSRDGVNVTGAEHHSTNNTDDHASVNGWYEKKCGHIHGQPKCWDNKTRPKSREYNYRNREFNQVAVVEFDVTDSIGRWYYEKSDGYFIYREVLPRTYKRCTECNKIIYAEKAELLNKRNCDHVDRAGNRDCEEEAFKVWYICGPDGQPRYMHRHQQPFINQLTRNKWKAFNESAPDDDLLPKKKHVREDQNLRVVEYSN